MTRINIVPVQELSRQHLIAEYKEIMRLPGYINRSLARKSKPFSFSEIPAQYTLGEGHVKFFYNKCLFLQKRFDELVIEMLMRGYHPNYRDFSIFFIRNDLHNDYVPTPEALAINRQRIKERS